MPRRRRRARPESGLGPQAGDGPGDGATVGTAGLHGAEASSALDRLLESAPGLTLTAALDLLRTGELDVQGRLVEASNLDLYCTVTRRCPDPEPDIVAACVYKPIRGERPLDDFPDGTLAYREVAAHIVSEATGWGIVPPTIMREGPLGLGMVQLWIDVDESIDVVALIRAGDPGLRRMAVFDAIVNNADRKGGHMLPTSDGHIFGVDHGICFSPDPKLRTILWGWRGSAFNDEELAVLRRLGHELRGPLAVSLSRLLAPEEIAATARRVAALLRRGTFPQPDPTRPAIPWPPF